MYKVIVFLLISSLLSDYFTPVSGHGSIPFPRRGPGGGESSQGEIDMMEAWGSRPNVTNVYIHGTKGPNPSAYYKQQIRKKI